MARQIEVKIIGDASSLQRAFGQVERAGSGIGRTMKLAGLAVAGFGLGAAGALAKTGLQFAAMKEQAQIAFTTMLGSGKKAEAFLEKLERFAAKTPFAFPDLLKASQRLLAMGFAAKDVLPMMTRIGDAVSALGGGSFEIDRVTTALGQMQAKGKVSAEEMMQLTEIGIPAWKMLADALGVDVATAMDMVTKKQVDAKTGIDALLEGMEKYGGMMDKQSGTLSGLWSTTKDLFASLAGDIMEAALPALKDALGWLNKFLDRFKDAEGAKEKLGVIWDAFKEIGGKIGEAIASVDWGGVLGDLAGKIVDALAAVPWAKVGKATLDIGVKIAEGIVEGIARAFGSTATTYEMGYNLMWSIGEGIADAGAWVLDRVAGFVSAVGDTFGALAPVLDKMQIGSPFKDFAEQADGAAKNLNGLADELRGLENPLKKTRDRVEEVFDELAAMDKLDMKAAFSGLESALRKVGSEAILSGGKLGKMELAMIAVGLAIKETPTKFQVDAMLRDQEFRARIAEVAERINNLPLNHETKVELLTQEAKRLAEEFDRKIRDLPRSHDTQIDTPGAVTARDRLIEVASRARDIPGGRSVNVSTPGAWDARNALDRVRDAVNNIPDFKTVWIQVMQTGSVPGFIGERQHGGPVQAGRAFLVGEAGPELFVPGESGRIIPHNRAMGMAGRSSGGVTVNVHVAGSVITERDLVRSVYDGLLQLSQGTPSLFRARA